MPKLKAEFRKPKLTLYNTNYVALGVLTNKTHLSAHNITLNEQVNETPSLTFDFPMGGLLDGDSLELLIKYKNEYFVIKEIAMSDSDVATMNVRAEHIACELKGIMVGFFEDLIGETPETMWNTVIENCNMAEILRNRYVLETNIVETFRYMGYEDEKSVFEYLLSIAQQFDSCLLFSTDTYGKIHIELLHGDINRSKFIRKGKDLKQLNLTFSTESLFTKMTPFGGTDEDGIEVNIMGVNDGSSYITNYDYYLAKGMTQAQINSNPLCNQECVYRNEEIFDEEELLRLAQEELKRLSEPVVEGSISAIDLNVFEGGSYLSPILCERVIVIDKDVKYSISCKITSISLNFENPLESQIGISNVISYSSALKDLMRNSEIVNKVITGGDNGKPSFNASKVRGIIDGHIAQLKYSMEDAITDVTDAVILFENRTEGSTMYGALAIGSRGILISTQLDRVTNQWVWTTAIDAKGLSTQMVNAIEINGSQIRGDIISSYDDKTWINLNDGTFNLANKITYNGQKFVIKMGDSDLDTWIQEYEEDKLATDREINEIKDSLENFDSTLGDAFADGIITEVERIRIEDSLIDLEKEKKDIDDRYTLAINDIGLTGGEEDALKSAYTSFDTKYTQLVQFVNDVISDDKATESEKTKYQSKLREYNETIPPLTVAFDNALKKIAENKTKTLINETKSDIERDIQNVQQSVDGLEETMLNSFRDGIIDETEYKTIKESVHRLNAEKLDIDRNYEHLSVNIYIQSKTELLREFKDVYDNYVENHETLTSYIDETIGDRVATEEEITNINDMFNSYDEALAEYSVMQTKVMGEIADATASSNLDEYKEIVNKDITDVNTKINNLVLDVGGAISDNILDQAELRIIENSITALETEKADVDKRYTELMEDTVNFKGDARSALSSSYSNFNTAHTNLINSINDMIDENYATELEKQVYRDAVNSYNTALSTLSSAFDKALNEIAKNSAQAIMEVIRQEIQSDISDVQDNIDALEDYMGNAFRDGILSDAEKESIRTHLLTLATEKKDVEQQYTSLIGMTDLVGTAKTNLQDAYGNEGKGYVQAYNSLINTINQILNKTTVNESDRTSLTNSFNNHDAKLANYSLRVNEAIESISEKKKQDLNNNITAKIEVLQNAINLRVTETRMEEIMTEKVEGIEVGGRNLVRNSAFMSGKTNWIFSSNVEIDSTQTFNGHPTVISRQSGLTFLDYRGVRNRYLPNDPTSFKRGETLTLSCWYKAIKSTFDSNLALEVKGYEDNSTTSQTIMRVTVSKDDVKEDWTQISVTKTLDADWDSCYLTAWVEKNGTAWFTDFKLEKGNKVTDWTPSIEDTQLQFNALQDMANSLQNQVDGKIQTYYQSTDPSIDWTSTEKTVHEGDIWHDTLNNITYRWSGSQWKKLTDADAEEAKTLASSKARVFTTQPTTPYYVGDLWVQGNDYAGEIMRCIKGRTSGSYTASDWSKASKYTDDSFAKNIEKSLNEMVIGGRNLAIGTNNGTSNWGWGLQSGGTTIKAVTSGGINCCEFVRDSVASTGWSYIRYSNINRNLFKPNTKYTISFDVHTSVATSFYVGLKQGDSTDPLCGDVTTSKTVAGTWNSLKVTVTTLSTLPTTIYQVLYIRGMSSETGVRYVFRNLKIEEGTVATAYTPAPEDTEDYVDNLVYDLQGQIDNKIETHNQSTDPSTSWTTTDLKNKHKGDLWYNPSTKLTKRWSGTVWVDQPEAETLAKSKRRVFTSTPTVPYDIGDLWVTKLDGTGEIKTCKTAKTSSQSYASSDWVAPKYTDDTTANNIKKNLENNYYTKTETNTQITTSVNAISSQVTSIKTTVDEQGEAIKQIITGNRCHSLGAKINYSAFSTYDAGEIYLHGYNSSNKATDTDGSITWNGNTVTVTKGMINPGSTFPFNTDVYIFLSGANGSTLMSSTRGMFYDSSAKTWKYAGLIGDTTTVTGTSLYSNDYVRVCIGQFNMKSAEKFNYAYLYNEPVLLTTVAQQPDIITRLNTAELKITNDAIISAVSGSYLKKTDAETTYAKTSTLTQTQTAIEAKFSEGGANLVKNSNFINGLNHWSNLGSPTTRKVIDSSLGFVKALQITTSDTNQGVTQTISGLEVGQKYTLSAYVNISSGQCTIQVQNNQQYYGKNSTGTGKQWLDVTFTAKTTSAIVRLGRGSGGSNGTYYFTAVQFERGAIRTAWTAHSNEIYSGKTTIDANGITVTNGGLTIKNNSDETVLSADTNGNLGFFAKGTKITFNGNSTVDARKTELYCDSNNVFTMKVPFYNANNGFCVRADNNSGGWDIMKATAQNGQTYPLKLCGTSVAGIESSGNIVGHSNIYKVAGDVWYSAITSEPSSSQDSTQQIKYIRSQLGVSDPYIRITNENGSVYGAWIWVSDKRFKEDIIDINEPISEVSTLSLDEDTLQQSNIGLDTIMKIHHYSFKYNEKSKLKGSVKCGYISQQLQEVEPNFVCEIEQEDGESLLQPVTHTFIPYLSKAIQEQQEIIDNQQEQIKSLEEAVNTKDEEIRRLEERLSAIEKMLKID